MAPETICSLISTILYMNIDNFQDKYMYLYSWQNGNQLNFLFLWFYLHPQFSLQFCNLIFWSKKSIMNDEKNSFHVQVIQYICMLPLWHSCHIDLCKRTCEICFLSIFCVWMYPDSLAWLIAASVEAFWSYTWQHICPEMPEEGHVDVSGKAWNAPKTRFPDTTK